MPSIRLLLWAMAFFFAIGIITAAVTGRQRSLIDALRDWVDKNKPDDDPPPSPPSPSSPSTTSGKLGPSGKWNLSGESNPSGEPSPTGDTADPDQTR